MRRKIRKAAASVVAKASGATAACLSRSGACQSAEQERNRDQDRRMKHIDAERVRGEEPRKAVLDVEVFAEKGDEAYREADGDEGFPKREGEALPVRPAVREHQPSDSSARYHDHAPDRYPRCPTRRRTIASPPSRAQPVQPFLLAGVNAEEKEGDICGEVAKLEVGDARPDWEEKPEWKTPRTP